MHFVREVRVSVSRGVKIRKHMLAGRLRVKIRTVLPLDARVLVKIHGVLHGDRSKEPFVCENI